MKENKSDREILDKYVGLDRSCLTDAEKKQVMDMLYKHKDAFSLRDKIGTCPNIQVEVDVRDKSPFVIRSYHCKEEDGTFIEKEMKRLCYLEMLKEGFSAYSSPFMLISRKVMNNRRVMTHLGI